MVCGALGGVVNASLENVVQKALTLTRRDGLDFGCLAGKKEDFVSYTVKSLSEMAGVSVRTLHYYEEVGLLFPKRSASNYRIYDEADVQRLQQILLYRDAGMALEEIRRVLDAPDFDVRHALHEHLERLERRRDETDAMIASVRKTIDHLERGVSMNDKEKFEGMKRQAVEENERAYGKEARALYGNEAIDASREKVLAMDEEEWESAEELAAAILEQLAKAAATGDPEGDAARRLCAMHKRWLCMYWPDGMYTPEAHASLAEGYVADERFRAYYDEAVSGGAQFLRDAVCAYCAR